MNYRNLETCLFRLTITKGILLFFSIKVINAILEDKVRKQTIGKYYHLSIEVLKY